MALAAGSALGPYRVLSTLGAGGMGEVYRALDTRLGREVAVKVLPPDVAHDPMRLERFAREARAAAALNHPNILAVHDVASDNGVHYLVAELLDGQSLADRLHPGAGALSVRKAIDLAQQIAQGLAAAHARGIVHRDLKPANVFVTADGRVKILDFGLAKQSAPIDGGLTTTGGHAPPDTGAGQVLGTVGYMAPEQVRGQAVDARADIFAFGALLYEMLAGRRAFQGDTAADSISAVLGKDPPDLVSSSNHVIPPALHRIVARCLEKDPAARFQSAADLAFALQALTTESTPSGTAELAARAAGASVRMRSRDWVLGVLAFAGIAIAVVSWTRSSAVPAPPPVVAQFSVDLPPGAAVGVSRAAVSPDGRNVVLYLSDRMWLYSLANGESAPLPTGSTRGAVIWAPDSSAIVYLSQNGRQLLVYRFRDRSSIPLAEVGPLALPVTGAWSPSGQIVIADGAGLMAVLDAGAPGGQPRVLRKSGEPRRLVAGFLPGGTDVLSVNTGGGLPDTSGLFRTTLDGRVDERIDVRPWDSAAVVDATTLLAKRGPSIYEVRLDAEGRRVAGEPRLLVSSAAPNPSTWSATNSGVLVHVENEPRQFRWFARNGTRGEAVGAAAIWGAFDLTPDGRRLVATRDDDSGSVQTNLWMLDAVRGSEDRVTFGNGRSVDPALSADGQITAFAGGSEIGAITEAFVVEPGQAPRKAFEDRAGVALADWSDDGRWFVYHQRNTLLGATTDLHAIPADGSAPARPVARCGGIADSARVAPKGRWLAFSCNESGRNEIYVVAFPGDGPRARVSLDGGVQPAWRGDASEIYFLAPDGAVMAAVVTTADGFETATPTRLFETGFIPVAQTDQYRVTADGQRFLVQAPVDGRAQRLRVIINWRERFKADPPAGQ